MNIPGNYRSALDVRQTQIAIKEVKDYFERALAKHLNLVRVSAPLFATPESGLNDNLNGIERPVSFDVMETGKTVEIVQSLAKWKRLAPFMRMTSLRSAAKALLSRNSSVVLNVW